MLLGIQAVDSITLMGVRLFDFYGVDRQTVLPLINAAVPTNLFYYAAPLWIAAI